MSHTKIGWLCSKHYQQYIKYGKPIDNIARTENDLNKIILENDYAKIELYDRRQNIIGYCLISIEDIEKCKQQKWRLWKDSIVTGNNIGNKIISIQYFILNLESSIGYVIDHINGNRFDNRRCNLRKITQQQNTYNKHYMPNNTTGTLGVIYDKSRNGYVNDIRYEHIRYRFGKRMTYEEAVYIRWIAEHILFKEFRNTTNDDDFYKSINKLSESQKNDLREYALSVINNKNKQLNSKNQYAERIS